MFVYHLLFLTSSMVIQEAWSPLRFKDAIKSNWTDYVVKTRGMQCYSRHTIMIDDVITDAGECYAHYSDSAYAHFYKTHVLDGKHISSRCLGILVALNQYGIDSYMLLSADLVDASPPMAPDFLFKIRQWVLQDEKHKPMEETDWLERYHAAGGFVSPLHSGYQLTPGLFTRAHHLIENNDIAIVEITDFSDRISVKYQGREGIYKMLKQGTAAFSKNAMFLVTESDVEYNGRSLKNWKVTRATMKMKYTVFNGITVPLSRITTSYAYDEQGREHIEKLIDEYQVSKAKNDSLFKLTTYGIPERALQPSSYQTTKGGHSQPGLPSTAESIPIWGWLTAAGAAFLTIGFLLVMTRRKKVGALG